MLSNKFIGGANLKSHPLETTHYLDALGSLSCMCGGANTCFSNTLLWLTIIHQKRR